MTKLISALLLVGSFAFAPSTALAAGQKTGFDTTTTTSQGGSGKTCTAGSPGCTTTTTSVNPAGNNPQPSTCDGPAGQCK
jgi:hypothetical protein